MNRIWYKGEPQDVVFLNRYIHSFQKILPRSASNWAIERHVNERFDHGRYGLKPKHRALQAHPTVNDELPNRIASGTVIIKPNIASFAERDVIFEDGRTVKDVDTVIFATGYSFEFAMLEDGNLIPVTDNQVNLYKYMYPPQLSPKVITYCAHLFIFTRFCRAALERCNRQQKNILQ
ncbi:unnamed protein product [Gongylonema pulchrum]|uniref:Flavin-containing monooxygenase n=1 Tax=Gongylonema pulchrum TaxID=637853 RepID=A0A183EYK0_9BILA|nr:unnamed protein product [Gongylonema pulchrum]